MIDLRRRFNRLKIKLSYRLGISRLSSMPKMLNLDPTNHCNLKCPLCPTGLGDESVDRGTMKLEEYKKVVDKLGKWLQSVNLYSWGEPFLNKSVVDMVSYTANENKIRTITSSHFNNISDEQIEKLSVSGLDKIIVSVDGATQEVYEKYRVGGQIDAVFGNMRKLVAAKRKNNSSIKIVWNFLVMKQNEHEMDMARQIAAEIGVELTFSIMRTNLKDDILGKVEDNVEKDKEWIPQSPDYNPYDLEKKERKNPITFCKRPWMETFVNWNGDVFPCGCVMTEKQYSMGNVFEQEFEDIWNGPKYIAARKELLDQPNDMKTICHTCKENGYYTP
ncbi:MAG: radical SAM protein [Candidatus Nitrohelix vancouverensis]|uniref:Radical SAM protein n=1 Tax=Candidatus Nitrohelix vancouverensis TaxID=2705534 RepID=A0A7T0C2J1_9BACT|nr:MAG: radical SAM protein [Candidatus Nitrohelix vancouverensis]